MSLIDTPSQSRYANTHVAIYFSGSMNNIYQLEQWLMPFQALNQELPILIIVRDTPVYEWLQSNSIFQLCYCKTMDSLLDIYENNDFKCILYVNNASTNFQSLMNNTAIHVHINHGESEKSSTFSNRAKAYDLVFLVADAGYERYENNLINITMDRFIKVGRPQLDWTPSIPLEKTNKQVVLYAPTWEGTHLSMNYSSLPDYGLHIVDTLLANDDYFLIYRPHPSSGSKDNSVKQIDSKIRERIRQNENAITMTDCDINAVFEHTDIAILDNSAIAIDFLHYDKPILMTDYFHRIRNRQSTAKIVEACTLINKENINNLPNLLASELTLDSLQKDRRKIQRYFLGCYSKGESTKVFIEEVHNAVAMRDSLIKQWKE